MRVAHLKITSAEVLLLCRIRLDKLLFVVLWWRTFKTLYSKEKMTGSGYLIFYGQFYIIQSLANKTGTFLFLALKTFQPTFFSFWLLIF